MLVEKDEKLACFVSSNASHTLHILYEKNQYEKTFSNTIVDLIIISYKSLRYIIVQLCDGILTAIEVSVDEDENLEISDNISISKSSIPPTVKRAKVNEIKCKKSILVPMVVNQDSASFTKKYFLMTQNENILEMESVEIRARNVVNLGYASHQIPTQWPLISAIGLASNNYGKIALFGISEMGQLIYLTNSGEIRIIKKGTLKIPFFFSFLKLMQYFSRPWAGVFCWTFVQSWACVNLYSRRFSTYFL